MTKECGTKQNTARQLLLARYNQSRGTSLKDNTQTKLRSDSANVTDIEEHVATDLDPPTDENIIVVYLVV